MDSILLKIIEQKIFENKNVKSYVIVPIIVAVDDLHISLDLSNNYLFLLTNLDLTSNEFIDRIDISSSDNVYEISKLKGFVDSKMYHNHCFRDYLDISTTLISGQNSVNDFKINPLKLEFLKVTPIFK